MKCIPWKSYSSKSKSNNFYLNLLKPCRGILLYGQTGCGKTSIATRIAYEMRHEFKFLSISCAEMIHKVNIICILFILFYK